MNTVEHRFLDCYCSKRCYSGAQDAFDVVPVATATHTALAATPITTATRATLAATPVAASPLLLLVVQSPPRLTHLNATVTAFRLRRLLSFLPLHSVFCCFLCLRLQRDI